MHFVNRNGRSQPFPLCSRGYPFGVFPGVAIDVVNNRARLRAQLRAESIRIGFWFQESAASRNNFELVELAFAKPRQKYFPHAGRSAIPHRIRSPVPVIKIADDAHAPRIWRPYSEVHTGNAIGLADVRAELLV